MNPRGKIAFAIKVSSFFFLFLWLSIFISGETPLPSGNVDWLVFSAISLAIGIPSGLLVFNSCKLEVKTISINLKSNSIEDIGSGMANIGYFLESKTGDLYIYKPSVFVTLLAGRILIKIKNNLAQIEGTTGYLRKLEKILAEGK